MQEITKLSQRDYSRVPIIRGNWGKQGPGQSKNTVNANYILLELSSSM
jgi:hypothetical protein